MSCDGLIGGFPVPQTHHQEGSAGPTVPHNIRKWGFGRVIGTLQELVEYLHARSLLPTYAVSNPLKLAQFDKSAR
tara:strand:- start:331 stop:555 length:225 start_codon:yes stop_codon:yes gene_type:complete